MYALILPKANSEMMSLFLAHVGRAYAGYFIVMHGDGQAGMGARSCGAGEQQAAGAARAQPGGAADGP